MRRSIRTWLTLALLGCLLGGATLAQAGSAPYYSRRVYPNGYTQRTKDAYLPVTAIDKFGEAALKLPGDLCFDSEDNLYIADTGNGRVLKVTAEGEFLQEIGTDLLQAPTGVFVNAKGELYVADPRKKTVFLFDGQGELIREYTRPDDIIYGADVDFSPSKVVSDSAGNVYIIAEGNTNGVIQLSRGGDFFGYVGANKTPLSLSGILRRIFSTDAQQAQMKLNVPVSPNNLAIDQRGLIYTTTTGGAYDGVKKFNMAGNNMLDPLFADTLVAALCVSPMGNIYVVSTDGYIAEYTTDGEFLFLFGGRDDGYNRTGLFVSATGIALDSAGMLYVLDADRGSVTVFEPSEYADTVHTALDLYQRGQYVESQAPWESALQQDAMFTLAYQGIGESYYKLEQYEQARDAFRRGYLKTGYSDAFWEIRNQWMLQNLVYLFVGIILLYVVSRVVKATNRRHGYLAPVSGVWHRATDLRLMRQLGYAAKVPKNPADAFYGIRFEGKVSMLSASILYLLFFIIFVVGQYFSGFLFKPFDDNYYQLGQDFTMVFGLLALGVISNHLICSISDGEGRLRDVYCGLAYCLMPYLFLKPIVILLSHVLTLNESFLIVFANVFIYAAIVILIFVMVKEIQAYSWGKTFSRLLLTVFAMVMIIVTGIILFTLINQVVDFVSSIFREVYYRALL